MTASILLPLYVYPSVGAWDPVYEIVSTHPRVHFTAIVNPNSGPGESALPDELYLQAIKRLNAFDNVRTVGYVATTWCARDLSLVLDDIAVYSGWGGFNPSWAMNGIFFDETPTNYDQRNVTFLQTISEAVRNSHGLKDAYVVHNPGALPDAQYFSDPRLIDTVDLTVVFEDTYENWIAKGDALFYATKACNRRKIAVILHSIPTMSSTNTDRILEKLLSIGCSMWLTGTNNYTAFGSYFAVFVDCLDAMIN